MPDRAAGKTWAALGALVLVAVLARAVFLAGPQLDYDEGVYWQSLRALSAGHELFSSVYSSQPPGFLLLLLPFYDVLGHSLEAARAGVALLSLLGIGAAYVTASHFAGRPAGLAAAALLVADPLYLRQSVTLQADGPALALCLAAVAAAAVSRGVSRPASVLVAGAAGGLLGLAVLVKLLALPAALPVAMLLWPDRRRLAVAAAGGALAVIAMLAPFAGRIGLVLQQSVGLHLGAGAAELGGFDALFSLARWEVPLLVLAAAALLVRRIRAEFLVPAGWLLAGGLSLLFVRPLWPHHLIAVQVPAALLAAPLLAALARRALPVALAAVLLGTVASAAIVTAQQLPGDDAARTRLQRLVPAGQEVISDDQFLAARADRSTPPELVDTSYIRVRSGDLGLASLQAVARRDRVRVLVLASGRLGAMPGLAEWAAVTYPTVERIGAVTFLEAP